MVAEGKHSWKGDIWRSFHFCAFDVCSDTQITITLAQNKNFKCFTKEIIDQKQDGIALLPVVIIVMTRPMKMNHYHKNCS